VEIQDMSRIPYITEKHFTEAQQRTFENITGGNRGKGRPMETFLTPEGGLRGPFNAWLYSPEIGDATQRLGQVIRFESSLLPRHRELAILMVAAYWGAEYEWWAHEKIAIREGVEEPLIESLKAGVRPTFEQTADALVYDFAWGVIDTQKVSDSLYRQTVSVFGEVGVVELVILLGYYTMVSMTLNVFEVSAPAGEEIGVLCGPGNGG
jgi:4-carboxymuconolactone decarboxylase